MKVSTAKTEGKALRMMQFSLRFWSGYLHQCNMRLRMMQFSLRFWSGYLHQPQKYYYDSLSFYFDALNANFDLDVSVANSDVAIIADNRLSIAECLRLRWSIILFINRLSPMSPKAAKVKMQNAE